jgi:serine phosphatase RsbU (regulator of sigma subunit)
MPSQRNGRLEAALEQLGQAAARSGQASLGDALRMLAEAAAAATGAELAVVRVRSGAGGQFAAVAVASASRVRAAEIEGTRFDAAELPDGEVHDAEHLPRAVRRIAERARADGVLQIPISLDDGPVATLELVRAAGPFGAAEVTLARLAAGQIGLCLRAYAPPDVDAGGDGVELAAEALAAAGDEADPEQLARLAAHVWGGDAALLWRVGSEGSLVRLAGFGPSRVGLDHRVQRLAEEALASGDPLVLERRRRRLPGGVSASAVVPLGRPASGALQLLFGDSRLADEERLARLTAFGVHAARALRSAERSRDLSAELERSRALLAVLGHAIAELSLAHTLTTALDRIGSLLAVERLAVYLKDGGSLHPAGGSGLAGPHDLVAERLLELALGPARARGPVVVPDARTDPRLAPVRRAVEESGVESALAVPLIAHDEAIGLLAAYPHRGQVSDAQELALFAAIGGQLAVAVQNARLHEQAKELGVELEKALRAEQEAGRRLRALYEVSRSFTQSLSLKATLEAVARAAIESLGVDAAILRVPDARGAALVTQALQVADRRLESSLGAMLSRAQVLTRPALQRFFRRGEPLRLDEARARALGGSFALLVPFLEKGSTAVVVPVATPEEVLATLTLISLDPADPISTDTVDTALSLANQAALAIDNARLYQQQKQFADTMQRSLLPRAAPSVAGVEVGAVYESSARLDVGGDIYDFMQLGDGRLAVVVGDVTGHGIDAAADMAMAKFLFRSLAREHPEPSDFLAHANDVVAGEIALGKFITLAYLAVVPARWEVACAAAGHPAPRFVHPEGAVEELGTTGLALGIDAAQTYAEVRRPLLPGASVLLYTDGVVEARRGQELYGTGRLDAFVAAHRDLAPQRLAEEIVSDCRRFGGGELVDDCAVIIVRRSA